MIYTLTKSCQECAYKILIKYEAWGENPCPPLEENPRIAVLSQKYVSDIVGIQLRDPAQLRTIA